MMQSIFFHKNTLREAQAEFDAFLATGPKIIKMAQCCSFDFSHKEIDFVLTVVYEQAAPEPDNKKQTEEKLDKLWEEVRKKTLEFMCGLKKS